MNAPSRFPLTEPVRHRFTRAEVHAMDAAGVFDPELDLELIDGELIEMPGDGHRTIEWNLEINRWLISSLGPAFAVVADKSIGLSDFDEPKPDFWVFDAALRVADVTGKDLLLVIEVADTTMRLDLSKAAMYARGGVREYWLIDVENRRTLKHRLGADGAYGEPEIISANQFVTADVLPALSLRIDDMERLRG